MKEYEVTLYELIYHTAQVTAENEDAAYDAAWKIMTGDVKGEYDTDSEGFTGRYYVNEV
jgi:hypothetical protein